LPEPGKWAGKLNGFAKLRIAKLKFPDFGGEILWLSAYAGSKYQNRGSDTS